MSAAPTADSPARGGRTGEPLRILFVMAQLRRYLRLFDLPIRLMLERGHHVQLVIERGDEDPSEVEETWLREIERFPNFTYSVSDAWRRDPWFRVARPLRAALDYVHFLREGPGRAGWLVARANRRAPRWIRGIMRLPGARTQAGYAITGGVLDAFDRAIPPSRDVRELIREERADVVLVAPHLMPGSTDSHYVKSTLGTGVPVVLCVPSWDNLSSKQRLRVVPDLVTVWNEMQKREAVELHAIPPERVAITGAQCFDHWFGWPPRDRTEFCARVGLDPERPYVLYAGGALFPSAITEAEFCSRWVDAIRAHADPALREVGILVRPHPKRLREWAAVPLERRPGVRIWPREEPEMPVGEERRADFFDSIYHSAVVVGINTSAMIEAGVIGRGVETVRVPELESSQELLRHFRYLTEGGLLTVAGSIEEHLARLAEIVSGRDPSTSEGAARFIASFVRPNGVDTPATESFVDAIEEVARSGAHEEVAAPLWLVALRPLLALGRLRFTLLRLRLKVAAELGRLRRSGKPAAEERERLGEN
jgi:hypothetical protein